MTVTNWRSPDYGIVREDDKVYGIKEAAAFAEVCPRTIRYWTYGRGKDERSQLLTIQLEMGLDCDVVYRVVFDQDEQREVHLPSRFLWYAKDRLIVLSQIARDNRQLRDNGYVRLTSFDPDIELERESALEDLHNRDFLETREEIRRRQAEDEDVPALYFANPGELILTKAQRNAERAEAEALLKMLQNEERERERKDIAARRAKALDDIRASDWSDKEKVLAEKLLGRLDKTPDTRQRLSKAQIAARDDVARRRAHREAAKASKASQTILEPHADSR